MVNIYGDIIECDHCNHEALGLFELYDPQDNYAGEEFLCQSCKDMTENEGYSVVKLKGDN